MAESLTPPLHEDPGIQSHRSHSPVWCRDLGSLLEADRLLQQFYQHCLCSFLSIGWQDYVSDDEVIKRVSQPSIDTSLLQMQLCNPKAVFFNELQEGKHDCGVPRKRYKNQLKRQLAQVGITHQSWQQEASHRDRWHSSMRKASRKFEAERHEATKQRHRRQKERTASQSISAQTFTCPKCGWVCTSMTGLYSQQ